MAMKRNYLKSLLLLLAMVWAVPKGVAADYDLTVNTSPEWVHKFSNPSLYARGMAIGPDYKIYTLDNNNTVSDGTTSYKSFYKIGSGGATKYSFGTTKSVGAKICNDEALNVIAARDSYSGALSDIVVWDNPASNTANKTKIDLTTNKGSLHLGSPILIWAEGDVKNGTGYIWYLEPNATEVWRMTVTKMVAIKEMSWPLKDASGNSMTLTGSPLFVHKYDTGKLYIQNRSNAVYDVQVDGEKATLTQIKVGNLTSIEGTAGMGGCIKMFKGHKLLFTTVYGASATSYTTSNASYSSQINVYDMSDGNKQIATLDDIKTAQGGGISTMTWVRCLENPDDANKLDIYIYKPGTGAAKYSITAKEIVTFADPVLNLAAERVYNENSDQDVRLTWEAPGTGTEYVTGYTIYEGDSEAATVGKDVLTWTDTDFTASTTYKVVPNYSYNGTASVGTDATVTIAPYVFTAPKNLAATPFEGYSRVTVSWNKISVPKAANLICHYVLIRNGAEIVEHLVQGEHVDTSVPPGEHTYTVEAVYHTKDADGKWNHDEAVARLRSEESVTVTLGELNPLNVNYTLEEVYNIEMWDIWDADRANGSRLPENFNPSQKDGDDFVDAVLYRQGALVTDADGKKWWYIMQRSNANSTKWNGGGDSGGILKISAEKDLLEAGGSAEMLTLPKPIEKGQSVGIATDSLGNIFVRGQNPNHLSSDYGKAANYGYTLTNGVIYSADLSKYFEVDLSGITFDTDPKDVMNGSTVKGRADYYRVSGDLMGTSYLYIVAGYSRTFTVVKMVNDGTNVTASALYQYTPTTFDSGKEIAVSDKDGAENYAFPIEWTRAGSKGYVYEKRSQGYLYIPTDATSNKDIYIEDGKIANTGGTTAKMSNANDADAAQLFIISPMSFYSRNMGTFTVGLVPRNDFSNKVIPIANFIAPESENIDATSDAGNCNANWLFAEWDDGDKNVTGDENLYIYQYVPGIRLAKYRLYGAIGFYSTSPDLTICTKHDDGKNHITHLEAKATWSTPTDYIGEGDYAIRHYKVDLLDKNNHVIDSREVPATENGADWKGEFVRTDYEVTFCTTADLSNGAGVEVGNGDNHFVDDGCWYTVNVTPVYDLTQVLQGTTTAASDLRTAATVSSDASLSYDMNEPSGTVQIYKGTGANRNVYRIEIDIECMEEGEEPVSHYELSYSYTPQSAARSAETVTVPIDDFVLVTADGKTEKQSVVPGADVRNNNSGTAMNDSQGESYVMFYQDNRILSDIDGDGYNEYSYPASESYEQIPTNWTFNLTAVYASGNSLLRNSTTSTMSVNQDMVETGVDAVEGEDVAFSAFPIPAEETLTVRMPQGIESISIVSAAGVEVKSVAGNGDNVMTIAVDDLAAGHYLLRVNNLTPIKIVKK